MCIVQPGSATVNSNGVCASPASTRADRCSPTTGRETATGTSTVPSAASATTGAGVVRPSPSTRTSAAPPVWVTRTSCSGASGGPVNNSVDPAEMTCTPSTLRCLSVCLDALETVAVVNDEILDFSKLFIDRAKPGPCLCAKVGQLCIDCPEPCLNCRETEAMVALVRPQCIDRGKNGTVVGLGGFQRGDARLQVFQRGHQLI